MILQPQIYLAPLQGFTDFHFRDAYQKYFGNVDQYFSPWIKLDGEGKLKNSQIRDIRPENNQGVKLIPQVMCNNSVDFLYLANYLFDLGYEEINWNLGCPHPMITKRGLGSALLKNPEKIISTLDKILPKMQNKLSIKMRLGFENEDESVNLLPLLNNYPLTEIIIHARTAAQMYKGKANTDAFENCIGQSKHKLVYNGDLNSLKMFKELSVRFPQINSWMVGRGLIANPFLGSMIKNDSDKLPQNHKKVFLDFHHHLMESYASHLSGEKHLLIKMISFWEYFSNSFKDAHKAHKRIKKAKTLIAYNEAVKMNLNSGFMDSGQKTVDGRQ
ncbi:MAG: dihydrouridine synthase [Bacteroidetes bacterium HGW-Bacteroidetes-17]|jgi:tRNA-dihydrouridine synthase|nr:MAG: dihydrouridine synthase [Bacteroidetes bacterium HGW-Bacteroidetes-17]